MFGIKPTLIYVLSGIIMGIIGGFILGKLKLESNLMPWAQKLIQSSTQEDLIEGEKTAFSKRVFPVINESIGIIKSVILYVLIGIGLGALMHGYIPTGFFEKYISKDNPFAVPIAVLLGVPMYSNAAGVLPIIQVLVQKGIPLGTAISFMMAVVGLSIPEATLLKKVMDWKMIFIFFSVVALCIILSGYLFNIIL
jgi:hypothetical protein